MRRINWPTLLFLFLTPPAALIWSGVRIHLTGVHVFEILLFLFYFAVCAMSITAGYHRLFAHRAYDCNRAVKLFFVLFGAAAFQHSVLSWASDHRRHHKNIDRDEDPYNIKKGFVWAHIGWMLVNDHKGDRFDNIPDLEADPLLRWQHRYYIPIAVVMSFVVPFAAGFAIGSPWGGLVWGGLVRVVVGHHVTFLVNSLAHTLGRQPYSDAFSARDSLVTALLTFGEGYHNYHHRFAADYRNGVRGYQFDPTKWLIRSMASIGLAWNLRRVPRERIIAAQVQCESQRLSARLRGCSEQLAAAMRQRYGELSESVQRSAERLGVLEREWASWTKQQRRRMQSVRTEIRSARREFRSAYKSWRTTLTALGREALPLPA
jgi:stearoyl-CoA desaturase (delta-9 desaturase)